MARAFFGPVTGEQRSDREVAHGTEKHITIDARRFSIGVESDVLARRVTTAWKHGLRTG